MPQFGDQHMNAKAIESVGAGIRLQFRDADEEMIFNALKTVLDPRFVSKIKYFIYVFTCSIRRY